MYNNYTYMYNIIMKCIYMYNIYVYIIYMNYVGTKRTSTRDNSARKVNIFYNTIIAILYIYINSLKKIYIHVYMYMHNVCRCTNIYI